MPRAIVAFCPKKLARFFERISPLNERTFRSNILGNRHGDMDDCIVSFFVAFEPGVTYPPRDPRLFNALY